MAVSHAPDLVVCVDIVNENVRTALGELDQTNNEYYVFDLLDALFLAEMSKLCISK